MQVQIAEMCSHPQVELWIKTSDSFSLVACNVYQRRFPTTKLPLLAGKKEAAFDKMRWRPITALNASLRSGWVRLFSTCGKLLTFDRRGGLQREQMMEGQGMPFIMHAQNTCPASIWVSGIRTVPGGQDVEQLMIYRLWSPQLGTAECQKVSGPSHVQEPKRETPYDCFLFVLLSKVIFSDFLSLLWFF